MINISQSLIVDFLKCPRMAEYRIIDSGSEKKASVPTKEMMIGTATHYIIEKYWNNKDKALGNVPEVMNSFNIETGEKQIYKCIENFFQLFPKGFFSEDDEIEKLFKIKTGYKDVFYVGKFDRIHDNIVYDWKTGQTPPKDINYSPQFIFYQLCYKKLYKKFPSNVVYVDLLPMKLYYYTPIKGIVEEFEKVLIPSIIKAIKESNFPASGLFGYRICERCVFKEICYSDIGIK